MPPILILHSHSRDPTSSSGFSSFLFIFNPFLPMALELEKPRVTEIQVRIDCNGCVQKIKKALHGVNGVYDIYIDLPQQKLTIIGWAEREKIVKAIRKTRKNFTVCSHVEPAAEQPQEVSPEGESPTPDGGALPPTPEEANTPPPPETPQAEPAEPPKDTASAENPAPPADLAPAENPTPPENPPQLENLPSEVKPSPIATDINADANPSTSQDIGGVHDVHLHPPDYGYRYCYGHGSHPPPPDNGYRNCYGHGYGYGYGYGYPSGHGFHHEAEQQPAYVNHNYNIRNPSPYVTEYARSPPRQPTYSNRMMDHYSDYYGNNNSYQYTNSYENGKQNGNGNSYGNGNGNGNFTSMFSDENPNICNVM